MSKEKRSEENMKNCKICSNPSKLICSNCGQINYCSKKCQKQDWILHKTDCKPFLIETNPKYGRYLVAARNIKAGELILKETPVVVGPSVISPPLCFNCYIPLVIRKATGLCPQCKVAPLCTNTCIVQRPGGGHTSEECAQLRNNPYITGEKLMQHFSVATPLRCLILREKKPEIWDQVLKMESHLKIRRNTPIWRNYKLNIESILNKFNVLKEEDIKSELVQKICGILDVNSFELRISGMENNWAAIGDEALRGLYLQAALMAHDCVGNTHLAVDDQFNLNVHASAPIQKGETILFNYTNALQGTVDRKQHLKEGKYFDCNCKRCSDPTEFQTFMSSIICVKCRNGFVSPLNTSEDVFNHQSFWGCSEKRCNFKCRGSLIASTVNYAKTLTEFVDKSNIQSMELLLKKLLFTFSPQHSIILDLKQSLVGLYSETLRTEQTNKKILIRKLQLCKEMLPILEKIEPGISRLAGITLYEMHIPVVILANREYDNGDISVDELLKRLNQAEESLKKSISYLVYEPVNSPEGRLNFRAINELKLLRKNIENVQKIIENKRNNVEKRRRRKK